MTFRHRVVERRQLPIPVPLPVIPSPPITHRSPLGGRSAFSRPQFGLLQSFADGLGLGGSLDLDTMSIARPAGRQEAEESAAAAGQGLHLETASAQLLELASGCAPVRWGADGRPDDGHAQLLRRRDSHPGGPDRCCRLIGRLATENGRWRRCPGGLSDRSRRNRAGLRRRALIKHRRGPLALWELRHKRRLERHRRTAEDGAGTPRRASARARVHRADQQPQRGHNRRNDGQQRFLAHDGVSSRPAPRLGARESGRARSHKLSAACVPNERPVGRTARAKKCVSSASEQVHSRGVSA
jgi:hypothetical protein